MIYTVGGKTRFVSHHIEQINNKCYSVGLQDHHMGCIFVLVIITRFTVREDKRWNTTGEEIITTLRQVTVDVWWTTNRKSLSISSYVRSRKWHITRTISVQDAGSIMVGWFHMSERKHDTEYVLSHIFCKSECRGWNMRCVYMYERGFNGIQASAQFTICKLIFLLLMLTWCSLAE
jgi:hypothetical protein